MRDSWGGQGQAAGTRQPKSTKVLGNKAVCAKTNGGDLGRGAFTALGLLFSLLC